MDASIIVTKEMECVYNNFKMIIRVFFVIIQMSDPAGLNFFGAVD